MQWLILSLLSAFSQSNRDLFSKKCLRNLDGPLVAFLRSFFSLPFLLPFFFFAGIPNLDNMFWLAALASSGLSSVDSILFMKAIRISPLSLTVPMLAFTPLFLLITSPLMLGESPSYLGLVGIFLMVFGAYVLNIKDVGEGYFAPFKALAKERGSLIMLVLAFLFSIGSNIIKIGVQHSNALFFLTMQTVLTSGFLFPAMLMRSKTSFKAASKDLKSLFAMGLFNVLMSIFVFSALELAIVPYVITAKRTTIIFSTFYGYLFFKEKRMTERLAGASIMVLGVVFMSLF